VVLLLALFGVGITALSGVVFSFKVSLWSVFFWLVVVWGMLYSLLAVFLALKRLYPERFLTTRED
jgi:hypothetical protein